MKKNKKGFTLAELLIVVAVIAVLVAIAIPVFTTQLEKAKEATDAANIRSAYAEVMSAILLDSETDISKTVAMKQSVADWQNTEIGTNLAALATPSGSTPVVTVTGNPTGGTGKNTTIAYVHSATGGTVTITIG